MPGKSKVHYLLTDDLPACGKPARKASAIMQDVTCQACKDSIADMMAAQLEDEQEDASKEEPAQEEEDTTDVIYTLAPATLDKIGSRSMGVSQWLYKDDNVPEQALRKVVVYPAHVVDQLQAYRLKVPYITFTQKGLEKAQAKGLVYRKDEEEISPIVAAIDKTIASIEDAIEQTAKEMDMARNKAPKAPETTTPAPKAPIAPKAPEAPVTREDNGILDILRMHAERLVPKEEPKAPVNALDAILAAPIGGATILRNPPPQKALPLPEERTEEKIVAAMSPDFAMNAAMYKAFVQAFRQALAEEGLVIVRMEPGLVMSVGCGEESPREETKPFDPMEDSLASIMAAAQACTKEEPAKPKSTLKLGKDIPQPGTPQTPANNGKKSIDPVMAKAIQAAWNNRGKVPVKQSELAAKYNLDDKKVWFICNRMKQVA